MSKALISFSIFVLALAVESRPSSNIVVACTGCDVKEIIPRTRRDATGILNSVSGLVGNILHETWVGIERTRAARKGTRNIYIGNGRNNNNKVYMNRRRN